MTLCWEYTFYIIEFLLSIKYIFCLCLRPVTHVSMLWLCCQVIYLFFFVKNHMDSKSFFFRMVWLYLEWFLSSLHTFMDKGSSNNVCRTCAASRQSFTPFGCIVSIWQIKKDKEFLSFISGKWNGIRHLVFWSLETLTGLKDQVRRLVA